MIKPGFLVQWKDKDVRPRYLGRVTRVSSLRQAVGRKDYVLVRSEWYDPYGGYHTRDGYVDVQLIEEWDGTRE